MKWLGHSSIKAGDVLWAKNFCHQLQSRSWHEVSSGHRSQAEHFSERMLMDLLLSLSKSARQAAGNFRVLADLLKEIEDLKSKTKSLMMVPQLQALTAALLALSYSVLMPFLFPEFFPSFLHLGLHYEFFAGQAVLGLGLASSYFISTLPKRYEKRLIQPCYFFHILAYRLESGENLEHAWSESLQSVEFPKEWNEALKRGEVKSEAFDEFLMRLGEKLKYPWTDLAMHLQWALRQSSQLAPFLRQLASSETSRVGQLWELESKRLSIFILLPLLLLCFPASLYLILGPQFILLWK